MNMHSFVSLCILIALPLMAGCRKKLAPELSRQDRTWLNELDFSVRNDSLRRFYVTCFFWAKKADAVVWRWYKSPVYELPPKKSVVIDIDTFFDKNERDNIYGWLGVFESALDADVATFASAPDQSKISLGRLAMLKRRIGRSIREQEVVLFTDLYGFKGERIEYRLEPRRPLKHKFEPSLDFWVENKTGDPIMVNCFVYEHQKALGVWDHDSTDIVAVAPNERKRIEVDKVGSKYDWSHEHGHLGIYVHDAQLEELGQGIAELTPKEPLITPPDTAETATHLDTSNQTPESMEKITFELLSPSHELILGNLSKIRGKTLVIYKRPYGLSVNHDREPYTYFLEYDVKD